MPVVGNKTVDQLLTEAGLKAEFKSRSTPPVIHYTGVIDSYEVEIEFLTDQKGRLDKDVIKVQKGLHAETLRYLSIIIENTIEIDIDDFSTAESQKPIKVRIPSPEAFIFNKGLTFIRRQDKGKKAKDLYYIFDLLTDFKELDARVYKGMKCFKQKYKPWFRAFVKNLSSYFDDENSEGVLLVLSQRVERNFPKMKDEQFKLYVYDVFKKFLEQIGSF